VGESKPFEDDPMTRSAVLDAYREARLQGRDSVACYAAAVEAWCAIHPDHRRARAASRAVKIVHESFGSLQEIALQ
jgi:hypothetical protein